MLCGGRPSRSFVVVTVIAVTAIVTDVAHGRHRIERKARSMQ
jgi:hypothetical protein